MNIKMKTDEVLKMLQTNREKHIGEYAAQVQGWKKAMEQFAEKLNKWRDSISEDIFEDKVKSRPQEPQRPTSYVADYDKYIELLSHHEKDMIEIEEHEFKQIIKDEFQWKRGFMLTSAMYNEPYEHNE